MMVTGFSHFARNDTRAGGLGDKMLRYAGRVTEGWKPEATRVRR